MNYYQEITLIDGEKNIYEILSQVYTQLHIALADVNNKHGINNIGIGFPTYKYDNKDGKEFGTLGNKLRIFAKGESDLQTLDVNKWLERLTDYIHIKAMKPVPREHAHTVVSRYRHKNLDKQAKNFAKFKGISLSDALAHCQEHKAGQKNYHLST